MVERRRFDRRTGLVLLALAVASNFLPWMELGVGETVTFETVGFRELGPGLGLCGLAALLVAAAWIVGRRWPVPILPRLLDPRSTGLRGILATCVVNALLTAVILFLRTRETGGPLGEFGVFSFLWCLVALPVQVAAAFALGRGSVASPGRRLTLEAAPIVSA